MTSNLLVLLDDARGGRLLLFTNPRRIIVAHEAEEVAPALAAVNRAVGEGLYAAGYFSYELGYALEGKLGALMPKRRSLPFAVVWYVR